MLIWIVKNLATILVSLLLIGIVAGIIVILKSDKKKGKSSCGGSCCHCPMAGKCHPDK